MNLDRDCFSALPVAVIGLSGLKINIKVFRPPLFIFQLDIRIKNIPIGIYFKKHVYLYLGK